MKLNNLRKLTCLRKSDVSVERILVCNVIENLAEHGILCRGGWRLLLILLDPVLRSCNGSIELKQFKQFPLNRPTNASIWIIKTNYTKIVNINFYLFPIYFLRNKASSYQCSHIASMTRRDTRTTVKNHNRITTLEQ